MTQTNEWGVDEDPADNAWGEPAPAEDDTSWGDDSTAQWGDDTSTDWSTQPHAPAAWGDVASGHHDDSPTQEWTPATDDFEAATAQQESRDSYKWSEDEQDSSPLGRFEAEEPRRERKVPPRLLMIGGGVVVALVLAIFIFVNVSGGGPSAEPKPTENSASTDAVPEELKQFEPFAKQLQDALNERDAEAYHALIAEASQKHVTLKDAQAAVDNLPPGAQYEVVLVNGSAAGPTATVKLTLVRTLAGETSEQNMTTQLAKEGDLWRMVVKTNDQ